MNAELENLFDKAEEYLVIISPYIKLHPRFVDSLKSKIGDPKFEITIVFGKNENNLAKSFNSDDLEFLKGFPNIEIRYESRLHAKYYANESVAILSSMNLYDYSQNNNIEFGIVTKSGKWISDGLDEEAFNYFSQVIENSKLLFQKEPMYEKKNMGFSEKYTHSEVRVDEIELDSQQVKNKKPPKGYCIRTGVEILFSVKKPLSDSAYKQWKKYGDENYSEKYCHFSGEESKGETSFAKPILKKNWNKAKNLLK